MQGNDLRALRKSAKLTQGALADAIGMSRKTVNEMELDKAPIEKRTELAVRYVVEHPERFDGT
ncbi:MAG: hypothetical protein BGN95_03890 [Sphingomonas sp. 66-10]|mgnify:CR=1 FL=1|jgi:DNA-binding XRE family transcriptional regulator|uniref:helix-turn-helix transcriptional regulator n=1 Tax=Sphingomonas sp. 66-10 TaxID=1895848 RepID=UPI00092A708D|nr:helix-turn-helix transcriptional regulator [Sphingomonas sp. 66-10]OJU22718.1 MAG: hypothetical protein BGN95_03890 [Sphingomonas sp. 66-10]